MVERTESPLHLAAVSLRRPYRVTWPMVLLVSLVPLYIFIPALFPSPVRYSPAFAWDHDIPLEPASVLVYGAFYLYLILLPIFVVREPEHVRRTVAAYLFVWIASYVGFVVYPTVAPRPSAWDPGLGTQQFGSSLTEWGVAVLYAVDTPYNCFPSLHVAHSFVSALTTLKLDRRLGITATFLAVAVGVSTLFTRQHYVADVVAGTILAFVAWLAFIRPLRADSIGRDERRAAPYLAILAIGPVILVATGYAIAWLVDVGS